MRFILGSSSSKSQEKYSFNRLNLIFKTTLNHYFCALNHFKLWLSAVKTSKWEKVLLSNNYNMLKKCVGDKIEVDDTLEIATDKVDSTF